MAQSWENFAAWWFGLVLARYSARWQRGAVLRQADKLAVGVALLAAQRCVLAGEWEFRRRAVIEFAALPLRRGVAGLAGCREAGRPVVRVCRCVERRQVAPFAGLRRPGEFVAHVALLAGYRGVLAREWEFRCRVVVELSTRPLRSGVTGSAGNRKPGRLVIRLVGVVEVHHVA